MLQYWNVVYTVGGVVVITSAHLTLSRQNRPWLVTLMKDYNFTITNVFGNVFDTPQM